MPSGSYEEILKAVRSQGVQYLVVDEKIENDSPNFWQKSKEGNLVPLLDLRRKDRRMVVFLIDYPQGK
jgi:ActR/RegA family two-component response regulator